MEKETNKKRATRHRHIAESSMGRLKELIIAKAKMYGKEVVQVDRYYPSSQICHCCGHIDGKKDLNIRVWICPKCKTFLDRDINAAINILNEGKRIVHNA